MIKEKPRKGSSSAQRRSESVKQGTSSSNGFTWGEFKDAFRKLEILSKKKKASDSDYGQYSPARPFWEHFEKTY